MVFQMTKKSAPGKSHNRGITLEGEEAAMEEGLLEDMDSEETNTSDIKLEAKKNNDRTVAEFARDDDAEHGRNGKAAEIPS
jgi:hypothetical protein